MTADRFNNLLFVEDSGQIVNNLDLYRFGKFVEHYFRLCPHNLLRLAMFYSLLPVEIAIASRQRAKMTFATTLD